MYPHRLLSSRSSTRCSGGAARGSPELPGWRATRKSTSTVPLFDLINAAYPGHSAVVGRYMLSERILPFDPDIVILGFSANNAFRFSLAGDIERFRNFELRKLMLRSRLFHIAAANLANRHGPQPGPRSRKAVLSKTSC